MADYNQYPTEVYAGFWMRFFAYCLDLIIIGSVQRIFTFFLEDGFVRTAVGLMLFLAYFMLMTKLSNGQTLGKMVFGLRVICLTEDKLSWRTIVVRELFGRYLQKSIWILYVVAAFTPKKQHVVDLLCDTAVISETYVNLFERLQPKQEEVEVIL